MLQGSQHLQKQLADIHNTVLLALAIYPGLVAKKAKRPTDDRQRGHCEYQNPMLMVTVDEA